MKLAFSGIALSLGMLVGTSFGQSYNAQPNSAYQQYRANYRNVAPGSRYQSARTAFRMNLQDARGSEVNDPLPSPSDIKADAPDQQVIGTSPSHSTPTVAEAVNGGATYGTTQGHAGDGYGFSGGCNSGYVDTGSYVNYGSLSSNCNLGNCFGAGSGKLFGGGSGLGRGVFGGGNCGDQSCTDGMCGDCDTGCSGNWYGGIYGLIMTRSDDYGVTLSYDSAFPNMPTLRTDDGQDDYFGGFETRIGKCFCNNWSVEGIYWGLYPDIHDCQVQQPSGYVGDLRTGLGFNRLVYDPGTGVVPVSQMFGDATRTAVAHRLRRSYEVHNAEINFVNARFATCGKFSHSFLAGVRYFKYNDGFSFSTDYVNTMFGDDPANELHYSVDVNNHLVGFQFGDRMNYQLGCKTAIIGGANFGVYNNHITHRQRIIGGNGYAYDSATLADYNYRSTDDDLAFLGDISLGVAYNVGCSWRLTGGYRLTAASGIANSSKQIPRDREFYMPNTVQRIHSDDSLVLHGAFFGVEHVW
ncbi:MAG: BBP7 family outer membrane beta-barrel protein [Planctomycetales bacterium]|nr:BBP7 family outer membrane beta-barrel protein [Planctomycetales bacterium]